MSWYFHAYPKATGFDAHHGKGDIRGYGNNNASNIELSGALFGRVWDLSYASWGQGQMVFAGRENLPLSRSRIYHIRARFGYNGVAVSAVPIFSLGVLSGSAGVPLRLEFTHLANGNLACSINQVTGLAVTISNASFGNFSPVLGQAYDIQLIWDGTGAANSIIAKIDGVTLGTLSPASAREYNQPMEIGLHMGIVLGAAGGGNNTQMRVEEFAINDDATTDLSGFTGASRTTNLVNLPAFSGNSWPAVANTSTVETWHEYNVQKTGELSAITGLDLDYVINTQTIGLNGVPTPGRYVPVQVSDVRYQVVFGPNGSLTGTNGQPQPGNEFFAPMETQRSIFQILSEDDEIIDLLGEDSAVVDVSAKVYDFVPDNSTFPYIRLQILPFTDRDNKSYDGFECEFQVDVWYQPGGVNTMGHGNMQVQLIQKRIDQLINKRKICIDGWNSLVCRRTLIDIVTQEDNVTKQGIQRFKLFLGGK